MFDYMYFMNLTIVHTPIQVANVCIFQLQIPPFSGSVVYKITIARFLYRKKM